jgi:L-fucose dehydrogenase
MDLDLKNKVIIVTGAAKGIGNGIAKVLANEGALVVLVGRNGKENEAAVLEIQQTGGQCFQIEAELSLPESSELVVNTVIERCGRIDGLVNNAGANDGIGLENGSYERFMESLHRNLVHYYLLAHYALPALKKSKGSIVNISSRTAETGQGGTSAYVAANGARNALTREWAVELLPFGIRVNAMVVADCWTPLYEKWVNTFAEPEEKLRGILKKIPLGNRMTTTEEIANMTAFLLSDRSSHTTGQLIHVDGGYVHLDRALS